MKTFLFTIVPYYEWVAFWMGWSYDQDKQRLYIQPIPMFGLRFSWFYGLEEDAPSEFKSDPQHTKRIFYWKRKDNVNVPIEEDSIIEQVQVNGRGNTQINTGGVRAKQVQIHSENSTQIIN